MRDAASYAGDVVAILLPVLVAGLAAVAVLLVVRRRQRRWLLPAGSADRRSAWSPMLGPWLPADAGAVRPGAGGHGGRRQRAWSGRAGRGS